MTSKPSNAPYLIPSSKHLIHPCSLFVSEPLVHVGSLTLSCMQGLHTYVGIGFSYFLLLICLSNSTQIDRLAKTTLRVEKVCFSPTLILQEPSLVFLKMPPLTSGHGPFTLGLVPPPRVKAKVPELW